MGNQRKSLPGLRYVFEITVTPKQPKVRLGSEIRNAGIYADFSCRIVSKEIMWSEIEIDEEALTTFYTSQFGFLHRHLENTIYAAKYALGGASCAWAGKHVKLTIPLTQEAESISNEFEREIKGMLKVRSGAPKQWSREELIKTIKQVSESITNPRNLTLESIAKLINDRSNPDKPLTADSLRMLTRRKDINWKELKDTLKRALEFRRSEHNSN